MKYILLILAVACLYGCSNYYTATERRTVSLTPDEVRLNINLSDFEYMGKTEISVRSRKYLGLFERIDSINNRPYNYRDIRLVQLSGPRDLRLPANMQLAAYKVLDEFPDATYYIVSSSYAKVHRLFLGKWSLHTMEIQAYKYKVENR
ncbi:MAG TPA: hypothetical protein VD927_06745 [Chryseosolibacter sp.]|nr:hypothetical protein [Chryseosolibacter sp.]